MGSNNRKAAAEWFRETVFREEVISQPSSSYEAKEVPSIIKAARSLQNKVYPNYQSREALFLKQGKLLANYEEDSDCHCGDIHRYYPTYQDFSNQELRAYFSWRTKLRRGNMQKTSLSFAFLYIYELINQIGVADPVDGYQKLKLFQDEYGQIDSRILPYLQIWMADYAAYYAVDPALLIHDPQIVFNQSITILEQIQTQEPNKIIGAVKILSPKWLDRSRFYKTHQEDMDTIIVHVLRRVSSHYAARCKNLFKIF